MLRQGTRREEKRGEERRGEERRKEERRGEERSHQNWGLFRKFIREQFAIARPCWSLALPWHPRFDRPIFQNFEFSPFQRKSITFLK